MFSQRKIDHKFSIGNGKTKVNDLEFQYFLALLEYAKYSVKYLRVHLHHALIAVTFTPYNFLFNQTWVRLSDLRLPRNKPVSNYQNSYLATRLIGIKQKKINCLPLNLKAFSFVSYTPQFQTGLYWHAFLLSGADSISMDRYSLGLLK